MALDDDMYFAAFAGNEIMNCGKFKTRSRGK